MSSPHRRNTSASFASSLLLMRLSLLVLISLVAASGVTAQPDWRPQADGPAVSVDVLATRQADDILITSSSGSEIEETTLRQRYAAALVSARWPLAPRLTVAATLPLAVYSAKLDDFGVELDFESRTDFGIGNPYLGLAVQATPEASVEVGVWLPLSTDETYENETQPNVAVGVAGIVTDPEHAEAYEKSTASARLLLSGAVEVSPAVRLRGHLAPVFSYYTADVPMGFDLTRSNLAFTAGALVDGDVGRVTLTGGAVGRYEPDGGFRALIDEVFVSALAGASLNGLPVQPGVLVRVPVTGFYVADAIVGFSLDVPLR